MDFFLVFGENIDNEFSNTTFITTTLIPNIGEMIIVKNKKLKVIKKFISYINIEDYDELDDPDRGGEIIYIFTEWM